mgnify:CR=1 FL=1
MKKYIGIFAAFAFFAALVLMSASVSPEPSNAGTVRRTYAADTITNAEKDTLAVLGTFLGAYRYNVQGFRTSLSGTHNVKIYLDGSALTSGNTDWFIMDSTTTTSATTFSMRGSADAIRFRIRVSGTGTQSSRYGITSIFKGI